LDLQRGADGGGVTRSAALVADYCAAYPVDVLLQYSSLRAAWRTRRWYLLTVGTLFACAITYLVAVGLFRLVD
jgi:hypothetical protein